MTKSPKVIFNSTFTFAINNPNNKYKNNDKSKKRIYDMYDYYTNEEKRAMSMYDYYIGNINKDETMNLVLENGEFANKKEIDKRKKQAVKYLENSNLWQGVLSFNNDYLNKNIDIHKLEKELATKILPMFFKKCGFKDINKMFYQISLHTDTDNLHFHFSFMEKAPNYIHNNKLIYRKSGMLNENEINFLKNQVIHTIEKQKIYTSLLKEVNIDLEELKKYFNYSEKNFLLKNKKELLLEEKILTLGKMLFNERFDSNKKIKYGSIKNKEINNLTKEIKNFIFSKSNSNFKKEYNKFKNNLQKINDYFYNINKDNNINNIKIDNSLINNKNKYLENYVYNAIVNYSYFCYKKELNRSKNKIKENDIIKEIILKNYIQNKNQTKKNILINYLSNTNDRLRFKNKNAIEYAIKNINNEMEEAQKEFSKLFYEKEKIYYKY